MAEAPVPEINGASLVGGMKCTQQSQGLNQITDTSTRCGSAFPSRLHEVEMFEGLLQNMIVAVVIACQQFFLHGVKLCPYLVGVHDAWDDAVLVAKEDFFLSAEFKFQ